MNKGGKVFSTGEVLKELLVKQDKLSDWAKKRGDGFFLKSDFAMDDALRRVTKWTSLQSYDQGAVKEFLGDFDDQEKANHYPVTADYYLVAQALAKKYAVVTLEIPRAAKRKIKIPDVCKGLGVKYYATHEMLRIGGARFVLPQQ